MSDITRQIKKAVDAAVREVQSPRNMKRLGNQSIEIIRRRTLLGFGVPDNGANKERLKKLAPSYISQRRGEVAFFTDKLGRTRKIPNPTRRPTLSAKTSPAKSNLTFKGLLLDSMRAFVKGLGRVEIEPTGTRPDGLTNAKVAEFVSDQRPYLNLSNNEIRQVEQSLSKQLTSILRKKLTNLK